MSNNNSSCDNTHGVAPPCCRVRFTSVFSKSGPAVSVRPVEGVCRCRATWTTSSTTGLSRIGKVCYHQISERPRSDRDVIGFRHQTQHVERRATTKPFNCPRFNGVPTGAVRESEWRQNGIHDGSLAQNTWCPSTASMFTFAAQRQNPRECRQETYSTKRCNL